MAFGDPVDTSFSPTANSATSFQSAGAAGFAIGPDAIPAPTPKWKLLGWSDEASWIAAGSPDSPPPAELTKAQAGGNPYLPESAAPTPPPAQYSEPAGPPVPTPPPAQYAAPIGPPAPQYAEPAGPPEPTTVSPFVDAGAQGTLRGQLETQRQGVSQYGQAFSDPNKDLAALQLAAGGVFPAFLAAQGVSEAEPSIPGFNSLPGPAQSFLQTLPYAATGPGGALAKGGNALAGTAFLEGTRRLGLDPLQTAGVGLGLAAIPFLAEHLPSVATAIKENPTLRELATNERGSIRIPGGGGESSDLESQLQASIDALKAGEKPTATAPLTGEDIKAMAQNLGIDTNQTRGRLINQVRTALKNEASALNVEKPSSDLTQLQAQIQQAKEAIVKGPTPQSVIGPDASQKLPGVVDEILQRQGKKLTPPELTPPVAEPAANIPATPMPESAIQRPTNPTAQAAYDQIRAASGANSQPMTPEQQAGASRFEAKYNQGAGDIPPSEQQSLPGFEPPIPPNQPPIGRSTPGFGDIPRPLQTKNGIFQNLLSLASLPKQIGPTADILGGSFRQGITQLTGEPDIAFRNMNRAARVYFSKDPALSPVWNEIASLPGFEGETFATPSGRMIHIKSIPDELGFGKDFAAPGYENIGKTAVQKVFENIPGFSFFYKHGEAAYRAITVGNVTELRDRFISEAKNAGIEDPKQYNYYGRLARVGAGYGDVPTQLQGIQKTFYSMRNIAARFETFGLPFTPESLGGPPGKTFRFQTNELGNGLFSASPRGVATRQLTRFMAGETANLVALSAAAHAGGLPVKVDYNPLSTNYGKATYTDKSGNTQYFDFLGGYGTLIRATARTAAWANAVAQGKPAPYSPAKEWLKFARYKLAPVPALTLDWFVQHDPGLANDPNFRSSFATDLSKFKLTSPKTWADSNVINLVLPFFLQDSIQGLLQGTLNVHNPDDQMTLFGQIMSQWVGLPTGLYPPFQNSGPLNNFAPSDLFQNSQQDISNPFQKAPGSY